MDAKTLACTKRQGFFAVLLRASREAVSCFRLE